MIIFGISFVTASLLICGTIIAWKFVEEYDLTEWYAAHKHFEQIRKIIVDKAEIGDRLSDEEMKMLYKLVK